MVIKYIIYDDNTIDNGVKCTIFDDNYIRYGDFKWLNISSFRPRPGRSVSQK